MTKWHLWERQGLSVMQHLEKIKPWGKNLQPCHLDLWSLFASISHCILCHPSLLWAPCVLALHSSPVDLAIDVLLLLFLKKIVVIRVSPCMWLFFGVDVFICVYTLRKGDCVQPHISICVCMLRAACTAQHIWRWSKQKLAGHMSSCRCC